MLTNSSILKNNFQSEFYDGQSMIGSSMSEFDRFSENDEATEEQDDAPMKRLVKEFKIQLIAEKNLLGKGKKDKHKQQQAHPLEDEIQSVLSALHAKFPDKDVFSIVKGLYQNLIPQNLLKCKRIIENPNESQEEIKERLYQNNPLSKIERNIATIESLKSFVGFKKVYLKSNWSPPASFPNKHQEMLHFLKTCAAKSFVTHGHSVHYFQKEIADRLDRKTYYNRYNPSLYCIITEAYKFLEKFVLEDCQIPITVHPRQLFKLLFYRFIHCRKSFKNQECEVFLNIIKILYGLDDVKLDEYSAVRLYLVTQKGLRMIILKKLIDEVKPNEPHRPISDSAEETKNILFASTYKNSHILEPQNVWTFQLERELIQTYKKIQHFRDIKKYFLSKYPHLKKFLQGPGLKYRINQIIRVTLRRVEEIVDKNRDIAIPLAKLTKMNDNTMSFIVQACRGLKARLMLVDIYLSNEKAYTPQIEEAVKEINEALSERHKYNWRQTIVRQFEKKAKKQNTKDKSIDDKGNTFDDECDRMSTASTGSKFYAPTRTKDLMSVIPLKESARKPARLTHLYYKEEQKFIEYARFNDESLRDTLSQAPSASSVAFRMEKLGQNEHFDRDLYYGED